MWGRGTATATMTRNPSISKEKLGAEALAEMTLMTTYKEYCFNMTIKRLFLLFALQLQTSGESDDLCLIDQRSNEPLSIC
jgi:hypothetical protein